VHSFYQSFNFGCGPKTKLSVCDHGDCVSFGVSTAHEHSFCEEKRKEAGPEYRYKHDYWKIQPGVVISITKDQLPQVRELLELLEKHEERNSTPAKEEEDEDV